MVAVSLFGPGILALAAISLTSPVGFGLLATFVIGAGIGLP